MQTLRIEDGPPLPMAVDVPGFAQLQSIRAVPHIHFTVQLGLLRQFSMVDVEGVV
jgi:hypothetical protein